MSSPRNFPRSSWMSVSFIVPPPGDQGLPRHDWRSYTAAVSAALARALQAGKEVAGGGKVRSREAFRERRKNRGQQVTGVVRAPGALPKTRDGQGRAQLERAGLLGSRDL